MVRAIVGANWGDEGKGKITDMLAKESDIIIRFQGGSNAGHTIINDYGKFALHLLPSGVFYQHTTSIIGNGVALNIPYLIQEIESLVERGVPKPRILVSDRAQVLMPYHVLFDTYEEARLAGKSFGSTKSGIAPFYSDKYAKIGFQVSELFDEDLLREKAYRVCELKNVLLEHLYHKPLLDPEEIIKELLRCRDMIAPYVCDTSAYLHEAIKEGRNILLEGQLGSLKDPDHGIYPMVTSSSTLAAYGAIGAGIPPYEIKDITTVVKAYSSAVGAGAFVSEIFGDEADELRNRGGDGGEYGATTGRPRRVAGSMRWLPDTDAGFREPRKWHLQCWMCWAIWTRYRYALVMRLTGRSPGNSRLRLSSRRPDRSLPDCPAGSAISAALSGTRIFRRIAANTLNSWRRKLKLLFQWYPTDREETTLSCAGKYRILKTGPYGSSRRVLFCGILSSHRRLISAFCVLNAFRRILQGRIFGQHTVYFPLVHAGAVLFHSGPAFPHHNSSFKSASVVSERVCFASSSMPSKGSDGFSTLVISPMAYSMMGINTREKITAMR